MGAFSRGGVLGPVTCWIENVTTSLVDSFSAWAANRTDIDPDVADTLVTFKRDYLGDNRPGRWREGDLSELLLHLLPAKIVADDEWYAAVVPTTRSFLQFLRDTGSLAQGSSPYTRLIAELDDVESEFLQAVHDESRHGLSKAVLSAAGVTVDDLATPGALEAAMARFNALPQQERKALTDPFLGDEFDDEFDGLNGADRFDRQLEGLTLPAVRLPAEAELVSAARASEMLNQLAKLVEWLGPQRRLTQSGRLRLDDVPKVLDTLGLPRHEPVIADPELDGPEIGAFEPTPLRSARDHLPLSRLWELAYESEWIDVDGTSAQPGQAFEVWRDGSDADVLHLWADVFDVSVRLGAAAGRDPGAPTASLDALTDEAVNVLLMRAYLGESVTISGFVADLLEEEAADGASIGALVPAMLPRAVAEVLERFESLGAISLVDEEVCLTPLGLWSMNRSLREGGADAPVIGDPAKLTATDLINLPGIRDDHRATLFSEWVAARDPAAATIQIIEAARGGNAVQRIAAMTILDQAMGAPGAAAARDYVDDPVLGPHLRTWLRVLEGDPAEADQEDALWLTIDALAAMFEFADEPVHPSDLPDEVWELVEERFDLDGLWRHEHPELLVVLDGIASGHPRGRVRKAAKKARHKARLAGRVD
jgi:hypothetical protein